MAHEFVVIGEALTDCVHPAGGGPVTEVPGGSPLNVAIGLGRLGRSVLLAARYGDDERGHHIERHVRGSSVDLIEEASGLARTSSATATLSESGAASYVFDLAWDLTDDMVPTGDYLHVHTGSIGATLQPGAHAVREVLRREKARGASISYDPNARPQIMGEADGVREWMESLIGLSDVVKASDEDCHWLYPGLDIARVAAHWSSLGAGLVVVTRGEHGVVAFGPDETITLPTHAAHVVDTIGAGDSFMAGLLDALATRGLLGAGVSGLSRVGSVELADALRRALACAAITVSRAGANPPYSHELGDQG